MRVDVIGLLAATALAVGHGQVLAQSQIIHVQAWDYASPGSPIGSTSSVAGVPTDISFTVPAGTDRINIFSTGADSDDHVPRVILSSSTSFNFDIVVGTDIFRETDHDMDPMHKMICGNWGGVSAPSNNSTIRLWGAFTGSLSGTIDNVDQIGRLDIGGNLNVPLVVASPIVSSGVFATNIGASIASTGRVVLQTGTIKRVQVAVNIEQLSSGTGLFPIAQTSVAAAAGNITLVQVGGHIRGDIVARPSANNTNGRIGQILAGGHIGREFTSGDFGDPDSDDAFPEMEGALYNQDVLRIEASTGIDLIEAASMTCFIETARDVGFGEEHGCLEGIRTTGGSFKGSIEGEGINDNENRLVLDPTVVRGDIQSDFRGRLFIGYSGNRDGRMSGTFKIGGSMLPLVMPEDPTDPMLPDFADHGFFFPEGDDWLTGQVIINANDTGGVWTTTTDFNGTALSSQPYYTNLPSAIGGGSIGLAPFHLHETACTPSHNDMTQTTVLQSDFDSTSDATEVVIRNYGPVRGFGGSSLSSVLRIDVQNPNVPCEWLQLGNSFSIDYLRDGSGNILENRRAIAIRPSGTRPGAGVYRVRIVQDNDTEANLLVSADVTGEPPVVWPVSCGDEPFESTQAYVFRILADCDTDGTADIVEIAGNASLDLDLDGVLDSCESDDYCCDTNGSGAVTADDIFAFLDLWFAQNGQTGSGLSADFNQSNSVTADDIFAFLDCWFALNGLTCP